MQNVFILRYYEIIVSERCYVKLQLQRNYNIPITHYTANRFHKNFLKYKALFIIIFNTFYVTMEHEPTNKILEFENEQLSYLPSIKSKIMPFKISPHKKREKYSNLTPQSNFLDRLKITKHLTPPNSPGRVTASGGHKIHRNYRVIHSH